MRTRWTKINPIHEQVCFIYILLGISIQTAVFRSSLVDLNRTNSTRTVENIGVRAQTEGGRKEVLTVEKKTHIYCRLCIVTIFEKHFSFHCPTITLFYFLFFGRSCEFSALNTILYGFRHVVVTTNLRITCSRIPKTNSESTPITRYSGGGIYNCLFNWYTVVKSKLKNNNRF